MRWFGGKFGILDSSFLAVRTQVFKDNGLHIEVVNLDPSLSPREQAAALFERVPFACPPSTPPSPERMASMRLRLDRLRQSVEMLARRELTETEYQNERLVACLVHDLGDDGVVALTPDAALEKAIAQPRTQRLLADSYEKLASALERRQAYSARLF